MEGDGTGHDGLDPLFPSAGASYAGFNLFSQQGSTGGTLPPRRGLESLDLNSQAVKRSFPNIGQYSAYIQGGGGAPDVDPVIPPVRANRTLGVHRTNGGWSQREAGGGGQGRRLDFGGLASSIPPAPPGDFHAAGRAAAPVAAPAAAPVAGGRRRGGNAASARAAASEPPARGRSSRRSTGGGHGRRRSAVVNIDEEEEDVAEVQETGTSRSPFSVSNYYTHIFLLTCTL